MSYQERFWFVCSNCGVECDVPKVIDGNMQPREPAGWESKGSNTHWCAACATAVRDAAQAASTDALAARREEVGL